MNRKKVIYSVLRYILAAAAVVMVCFSVYFVLNPESGGKKRQQTEESLADAYLEELQKKEAGALEETGTDDASEEKSEPETEPTTRAFEDFSDDNYYSVDNTTYTPDYAIGTIRGVLEIERAGIRRGVYGGSWEAIYHDLDIWMVTEARPDYVLGQTHFVIYGHNHVTQDLSFNRLKDVQIGDVFTFTTDSGVYIYDSTDFFADWRENVTEKVVDNFNLPADKIYIVTCGRDEYRYKDIVVVGTLRGVVDNTVYNQDPEYYKYSWNPETEETSSEEETSEVIETVETKLVTEVSPNGYFQVKCVDADGAPVPCEIGIFRTDGFSAARFVQENGETRIFEEGQEKSSAEGILLSDGTEYVVGLVHLDTKLYEVPEDIVLRYHGQSIETVVPEDAAMDEQGLPVYMKPVILGLAAMILVMIILLLRPEKDRNKQSE